MTATARAEKALDLATFELAQLLEPIAGDNPAGESLRYEGTYDAIQEARREDDASLPQGVWQRELKKGDWSRVTMICVEALRTRSKDLQVGAWLLEGLLRLHGIQGGALGLSVLAGLVETFWDDLDPALEEDDLEGRLAPLEWINNKLVLDLKASLMTRGASSEGRDYSWLDWEHALYASHLESAAGAADDDPKRPATRSDVLTRVSLTHSDFFKETLRHLTDASAALSSLHDRLQDQCGDDAPSLSQFEETLEGMTGFVSRVLKERKEMEKAEEDFVLGAAGDDPGAAEPDEATAGAGEKLSVGGTISTRAEAYRMLSLAADYLMRTEPHSPAPYLVRRAVTWGGMPLADVLKELLSLGSDLDTVYRILGLHGTERNEE